MYFPLTRRDLVESSSDE